MIYLEILGEPVAKQRARTGKGFSFTPKKTADAEARIKQEAIARGVSALQGPLSMECDFIFEPPKSWSKKKRAAAMGTWKATRPDRDNCEKLVADALNDIAYVDDGQIVTGFSRKFYGLQAKTIIRIAPASERVPL